MSAVLATPAGYRPRAPGRSPAVLALLPIAAAHLLLLRVLLAEPPPPPVPPVPVLTVDLIRIPPPAPPVQPPAPRVPVLPRPLLTSAPSPVQTESPPPVPEVPSAAPSAPPPVVAEPPVAPVIPPNFLAAYLNNPPPDYPSQSLRLREQGSVLLLVQVSALGRAEQVQVEQSSGHARLDDAAVQVVRTRWRFVPAQQGDQAVAAWVRIPLSFELKP